MDFAIERRKSVVPALDVASLEKMVEIVSATRGVEGVGGYKIGFSLGLRFGLPRVVQQIRAITRKPVIYDHQKGATDIPDTAHEFALTCSEAGVDAVILFPQAGPETLKAWIRAAHENNLKTIVGLEMTHPAYLQSDGGFLSNESPRKILEIALQNNVREFVVPGNKPQKILEYKKMILESGLQDGEFAFHSPGLITQGGSLSEGAAAAGERWHAIIGRALYSLNSPEEIKGAAEKYCAALQ